MLQDEKNQAARAAFITSGAFLGYIVGRRGVFKKITYGLVGLASTAAVCNPKQAKDYAEVSCALARTKAQEVWDQYKG